jgi:hypothetical protein
VSPGRCAAHIPPAGPLHVQRVMHAYPTLDTWNRRNRRTAHSPRVLLLALAACTTACTTVIVPPTAPADPVPVFVLDHGRTPSLVLPRAGGGLVRYAYGDWNWYALRNTGIADGARALLRQSQGALGRAELDGPATAAAVRRQVTETGIAEVYAMHVERASVAKLLAQLEAEHAAGRNIETVSTLGLEFVPHPRPYTAFNNSNHAVAEWLRVLGVETRGPQMYSRWRVHDGASAQ